MGRLPFAALFGMVACSSSSPTSPGVPLGSEFTMRPGQTTVIQGTDAYLGFQTVVSDSRCPLDVLCVHSLQVGNLLQDLLYVLCFHHSPRAREPRPSGRGGSAVCLTVSRFVRYPGKP